MQFKDILVHLGGERSEAVLDVAVALARRHQAHLTGLRVITHRQYCSQLEAGNDTAKQAEALFREKTADLKVAAEWLCVDWPVVGERASKVVNLHAFSKDLVIVGQTDKSKRGRAAEPDLPERVILGSGRPVLIVPYAGSFATVGETAMVAWKAGRECARSLNDAMPFMLKANEVRVLTLGSPDAGEGADQVATHLARHGIAVQRRLFSLDEVSVGDVLLNYCWEERCDLLVVGGYTRHSRGVVLGPVARHILEHMTTPVLMSH